MIKKTILSLVRSLGYDIIKRPSIKRQSKRTNALEFYETATGKYFLPKDATEDVIANTIKSNQIFESEVIELAKKYIQQNTVVLDIGANFGQMSILFSNYVGERGKVFSFDADDFVFEILKRNISANKKDNVIFPFFGAVHNVPNDVLYFPEQDFKEFGSYGSYGIDYKNKVGRKVPTLTIDSLEIKESISFMKIDIQGGDLQAMQGAVNTIQKNKMPILFEYEYHFEDRLDLHFQDYVDFVSSIGYRFEKVINGHNYLIVPKK